MEKWKKTTLGAVCESVSITYNNKHNKVVLINTSDVYDGQIFNHEPVENRNLKGQFKKTFQKNDILFSEIRPENKRYAFVDFEDTEHYIASTKLMVIRPNTKYILPRFLFSILTSKAMLQKLQHLAETRSGTFPQITFGAEVSTQGIYLPELEEQAKIVSVMNAIALKIRINNKINDNLYQQLQAIYRQMFGESAQDDEPEGHLSDICTYSQRRIDISSLSLESYYSTENMLPGKAGAVAASSLPSIEKTTGCKPGDILISNIRPYFKKIVYSQSECDCSTDVLCFVPKEPNLSLFIFSTLYDDHFFNYMVAGSKGTKMPRGDKQQIMAYPVVLPSAAQLAEFNAVAQPILVEIEIGSQENKRLACMRNALLPKLMSGEIDVSSITL